MKKILIIIVVAVCILLYIQPEHFIYVENKEHKIYIKGNNLYYIKDMLPKKIIDEKIIDFKIYDIDLDNDEELIVLTKLENDNGGELVIFDTKLFDDCLITLELYRKDFSDVNPWKIDTCNLDNDDRTDIFIGVNKDTQFYKDVRKRPFFYTWDGEKLNKKWLGSFFTDWDLVDITFGDYFNFGYDVAAVLEKNGNDDYRVGFYSFTGFGFLNITNSILYNDVQSIETLRKGNRDYVDLNFKRIKHNIIVEFKK